MANVTYKPSPFQTVVVDRRGATGKEEDRFLVAYTVENVHDTATIRGWIEVNNNIAHESGPLAPGQSWQAPLASPLALADGTSRVGWGVQEV